MTTADALAALAGRCEAATAAELLARELRRIGGAVYESHARDVEAGRCGPIFKAALSAIEAVSRSLDEWTVEEVRQSVRASVEAPGSSHNVFARTHGISSAKLSEFLSGKRGAEPGIIEPCGYRWALVNANDYPRLEDQNSAALRAHASTGATDHVE